MPDKSAIAVNAAVSAPTLQAGFRERADLLCAMDGKAFAGMLHEFDAALLSGGVDAKPKPVRHEAAKNAETAKDNDASSQKSDAAVKADDEDRTSAEVKTAPKHAVKKDAEGKPVHRCAGHKQAERPHDDQTDAADAAHGDAEPDAAAPVLQADETQSAAVTEDDGTVEDAQAAETAPTAALIVQAAVSASVQAPKAETTQAGQITFDIKQKKQDAVETVAAAAELVADAVAVASGDAEAKADLDAKILLQDKNAVRLDAEAEQSIAAAKTEQTDAFQPILPKNAAPKIQAATAATHDDGEDSGKAAPRHGDAASLTPQAALNAAVIAKTPSAAGAARDAETGGVSAAGGARLNAPPLFAGGVVKLQTYASTAQLTEPKSARAAVLAGMQVVEQVSVKLHQQAKTGLDQMTIQLRPADLGRVDIKLDFHDGAVTGLILADNQATLDLLQKDQRGLERALQEAGLRTDSGALSFQLRDSGGGGQGWNGDGNGKANSGAIFDLAAELEADVETEIAIIEAGRVNLRV